MKMIIIIEHPEVKSPRVTNLRKVYKNLYYLFFDFP